MSLLTMHKCFFNGTEFYLSTTNYMKLAIVNFQTLMLTRLSWTKVVVTLAPSGVKVYLIRLKLLHVDFRRLCP